jgi:hypothetical protein
VAGADADRSAEADAGQDCTHAGGQERLR